MIYAVWLCAVVIVGLFAWFTTRKIWLSLAFFLSFAVVSLVTLTKTPVPEKPCEFGPSPVQVLGYKIDYDHFLGMYNGERVPADSKGVIWLFLDGEQPTMCFMPYTDKAAEKIQEGMKAGEKGGKLVVQDTDGEFGDFKIDWPQELPPK